jgi:hypothetical protein
MKLSFLIFLCLIILCATKLTIRSHRNKSKCNGAYQYNIRLNGIHGNIYKIPDEELMNLKAKLLNLNRRRMSTPTGQLTIVNESIVDNQFPAYIQKDVKFWEALLFSDEEIPGIYVLIVTYKIEDRKENVYYLFEFTGEEDKDCGVELEKRFNEYTGAAMHDDEQVGLDIDEDDEEAPVTKLESDDKVPVERKLRRDAEKEDEPQNELDAVQNVELRREQEEAEFDVQTHAGQEYESGAEQEDEPDNDNNAKHAGDIESEELDELDAQQKNDLEDVSEAKLDDNPQHKTAVHREESEIQEEEGDNEGEEEEFPHYNDLEEEEETKAPNHFTEYDDDEEDNPEASKKEKITENDDSEHEGKAGILKNKKTTEYNEDIDATEEKPTHDEEEEENVDEDNKDDFGHANNEKKLDGKIPRISTRTQKHLHKEVNIPEHHIPHSKLGRMKIISGAKIMGEKDIRRGDISYCNSKNFCI